MGRHLLKIVSKGVLILMIERTMTFNIPTYKRWHAPMLTLQHLPNARLWVAEFEYDKYKEKFPNAEIIKMPNSAQGLWSRARNYLLDHIDSDYFYIFDDDIKHFTRMTTKIEYLDKTMTTEELEDMFFNMAVLAEDFGVKMWGTNINNQPIAYSEFKPFSLSNPVTGPVTGFMKDNKCRYDENVNIKSDWDMAIQQAHTYGQELRVENLSYDAYISEGTGGSAEARNKLIEIDHLKRLRKKWGDSIVKLSSNKASWSTLSIDSTPKELVPKINLPVKGV